MNLKEIRENLIDIRCKINQIEKWKDSISEMAHQLQENLFDIEDNISYYKEYTLLNRMNDLKGAASGIYQMIDSPPRHSSRCSKDHITAAGFYQSDFDLKKII
jgi:hypothetical protein